MGAVVPLTGINGRAGSPSCRYSAAGAALSRLANKLSRRPEARFIKRLVKIPSANSLFTKEAIKLLEDPERSFKGEVNLSFSVG